MGTDVSFNRQQAEAAGLVTKVMQNGSQQEIEGQKQTLKSLWYESDSHDIFGDEERHLAYLQREDLYIQCPGRGVWLHSGRYDSDTICVTANRWGDSYAPLTKWLKSHNIEWSEF